MTKKNPHIGSTFESWLGEAGIREEVTAAAIKSVIARQIAREMKQHGNPNPPRGANGRPEPRSDRPPNA